MNLMRPRVSEVCYPEAMRHIVRKRTVTNKTPSQNNGDILIWSAGWLQQFLFFSFFEWKKEEEIVPCSHFYKLGMDFFLSVCVPAFILFLCLVCM